MPFLNRLSTYHRTLLPRNIRGLITSTINHVNNTLSQNATRLTHITTRPTLNSVPILNAKRNRSLALRISRNLQHMFNRRFNYILISRPITTLSNIMMVPTPIVKFRVTRTHNSTTLNQANIQARQLRFKSRRSLQIRTLFLRLNSFKKTRRSRHHQRTNHSNTSSRHVVRVFRAFQARKFSSHAPTRRPSDHIVRTS